MVRRIIYFNMFFNFQVLPVILGDKTCYACFLVYKLSVIESVFIMYEIPIFFFNRVYKTATFNVL